MGPTLPPTRRLRRAPLPADMAMATACGSQIMPRAAFCTPRSSRARKRKVESQAAPPPGLSALSASTTRPGGEARARFKASSMGWRGLLARSRSA